MTRKPSEAQVAVVHMMEQHPIMIWWTLDDLREDIQCQQSDLDALVRDGILLYGAGQPRDWWRLKQRALMPEQKKAVQTMQNKTAQECWEPDDLECDEVDLQTLENEGIIEKVYRLTAKGLALPF